MINNGLMSSNDQTWETPNELFDELNLLFNFNVDVCALPNTAKCDTYFTPEIDGLSQDWRDNNCWMNPPYGREQILWIEKANYESQKHNTNVLCLIPARPDTRVWQEIIFKNASAICFIKGRLKFGNSKNAAPFPSALVLFGNELNNIQRQYFRNIGTLVEPKLYMYNIQDLKPLFIKL